MAATATYQKLRNGDWGVRATFPVKAGQFVIVLKRDGSKHRVQIEKVIWSGDGVFLCAIKQAEEGQRRPSGPLCAECGRGGHLILDLEDGLMKHHGCCDLPSF